MRLINIFTLALVAFGLMILSFANSAFAGQPSPDASCPISVTDHTEKGDGTIGVRNYGCVDNGVNVVWSVAVPKACEYGGCGLIIDIHGAAMNADSENAGSKLREYGQNAVNRGAVTPYIVAQPNLTDIFDETIGLDLGSLVGEAYTREMPSMEAFIEDAIYAWHVDEKRVHLYGFSRGTHTVNELYCDDNKRMKYASFAMHGQVLKCDVKKHAPLLMVNGVYDFITPGAPFLAIGDVQEALRKQDFNERVLHTERNWNIREWVWKDSWVHLRGRHEHKRFKKGNYLFESVEHSGSTLPLFGHCHPTEETDNFLRCFTDFEIGEKIIDFFIAHPQK